MTTDEKAAAIRHTLAYDPNPLSAAAILLAKITSQNKREREEAKTAIRELAQAGKPPA